MYQSKRALRRKIAELESQLDRALQWSDKDTEKLAKSLTAASMFGGTRPALVNAGEWYRFSALLRWTDAPIPDASNLIIERDPSPGAYFDGEVVLGEGWTGEAKRS